MKKLFLLLPFVALLMVACATSQTPSEKAVKQAYMAQKVNEALDARRYTIDVNYVYPQRMSSRHLSYGYSLRISGDSIYSYLPFFGRAYSIPYGGGEGLHFSAPISKYVSKREKKDMTRVEITVETHEDSYFYQLEVYDNGQTTIDVHARERERIGFSGKMIDVE